MNKVILKGRLGADPDVRTTQNGKAIARLRLAVDRRGKDAGADWFDILLWEQKATFAQQYLSKGRAVLIEGRLQSRSYEKDGQKRVAVEVVAENIEFADSRPQGAAVPTPQAAPAAPAPQVYAAPQPQAYAPAAPQAYAPAQAAPPVAAQGYAVSDDDIPF